MPSAWAYLDMQLLRFRTESLIYFVRITFHFALFQGNTTVPDGEVEATISIHIPPGHAPCVITVAKGPGSGGLQFTLFV